MNLSWDIAPMWAPKLKQKVPLLAPHWAALLQPTGSEVFYAAISVKQAAWKRM